MMPPALVEALVEHRYAHLLPGMQEDAARKIDVALKALFQPIPIMAGVNAVFL
jgi:hypothetical protein